MPPRAQITGWGKYLPSRTVTNDELAQALDTSDEWIRQRTGIRERRLARPAEGAAEMAVHAAREALRKAMIDPGEIGLVIVATSTADQVFPSVASIVQYAIGANHAGAFDLSAACSGFVYALTLASDAISAGSIRAALVIGAEKMSGVVDWGDRNTCVLFGDGAGAIILQAGDPKAGLLASVLGSDGSDGEALVLRSRPGEGAAGQGPVIAMDGRRVFRFASRIMASSLREVTSKLGLAVSDLSLVIPHQANQRIMDAACEELGYPPDRVYSNLERYGNTSAASVPIALCEAADEGRLRDGELVALVAFGGGLSWGAAIVRWGRTIRPPWHVAVRGRGRQLWAAILWQWRRLLRLASSRRRRPS